jgi:hypothetical protein
LSAYPALRIAVATFWNAVAIRPRTAVTLAAVKLATTDESSLQ